MAKLNSVSQLQLAFTSSQIAVGCISAVWGEEMQHLHALTALLISDIAGKK